MSSILDNYLVLELWKHDQLVGIGRVPTHSVHRVVSVDTGRCGRFVLFSRYQVMGQLSLSHVSNIAYPGGIVSP